MAAIFFFFFFCQLLFTSFDQEFAPQTFPEQQLWQDTVSGWQGLEAALFPPGAGGEEG